MNWQEERERERKTLRKYFENLSPFLRLELESKTTLAIKDQLTQCKEFSATSLFSTQQSDWGFQLDCVGKIKPECELFECTQKLQTVDIVVPYNAMKIQSACTGSSKP